MNFRLRELPLFSLRNRFYRYINQKRKVKESIPPLMRKTGKLVRTEKEKAEGAQQLLCLSLHGQDLFPHLKRVDELQEGVWGSKVSPL